MLDQPGQRMVSEVEMANEYELAYLVISIILLLIVSFVLTKNDSRRRAPEMSGSFRAE